ncbi:MAG: vitamin K epoxide reductase [Micrococcales bacterium]|nr:vitamin K epoxide reductase [Micrococcales bacterium]
MTTEAVAGAPTEPEPSDDQRRYVWPAVEMLVFGAIGLIAALVLSIDAVVLAANPDAVLSCNINSKISCGAVGTSWQAEVFGFPNSFLGLLAEPVVITLAVSILAWRGRVLFPRWFMVTAQAVYSIGLVLAFWLFHQSYFEIGALCPWCLTVTATTLLVWMSLTRINVLQGNLGAGLKRSLETPIVVYKADIVVSVVILAIMAGMIVYGYL